MRAASDPAPHSQDRSAPAQRCWTDVLPSRPVDVGQGQVVGVQLEVLDHARLRAPGFAAQSQQAFA